MNFICDFFKKLRFRCKKKKFYEIISIDTHSTANLPPLPILNKLSSLKKPSFFSTKTQTSYVLRNRTISVAFWGKFATIGL